MKLKKLVSVFLTGAVALSLAACGSSATTETTAAETTAAETEAAETTVAETEAESEAAEAEAPDVSEMGPILKDIAENGVMKVGIIGNSPTFCFHTIIDGEDQLVGFEVAGMYEMADRLSDYLGRDVSVDFYESDLTGCTSALQANQIHFITRLSPTDERKENWLFTDVYHKSDECYVAKKERVDDPLFTGTLEGVTVAGQMGSIDLTMTEHLYPDAELQQLSAAPDLLLAVKNDRADLACMNAVQAQMAVVANPDLAVVDSLTWEPTDDFDQGCGLCMAYGNEDFADWASAFFADIDAEGLWDQMQIDAANQLDEEALKDLIVG
ncbi:MAG: transporter substrate-binding domain-containing protein [Candidatus Avilachnospira sp.]|jgi:ABC-type amino acid transport substrate-binding protein